PPPRSGPSSETARPPTKRQRRNPRSHAPTAGLALPSGEVQSQARGGRRRAETVWRPCRSFQQPAAKTAATTVLAKLCLHFRPACAIILIPREDERRALNHPLPTSPLRVMPYKDGE